MSILTLGLILVLHRLVCCETGWQRVIFKGLSSLMVALVLVILASAFQRLLLYEIVYGYTQLRLYSHIFMVWLALIFVWFLGTLWYQPNRFALGVLIASLGFLITLNIINPDAFIAEQNLARYQATGQLDVRYLTKLSDDGVPVLVLVVDQVTGQDQAMLKDHLHSRRERLEAIIASQSWPSFHLAQQRAYAALSGMN